jgi:hypothetical protein
VDHVAAHLAVSAGVQPDPVVAAPVRARPTLHQAPAPGSGKSRKASTPPSTRTKNVRAAWSICSSSPKDASGASRSSRLMTSGQDLSARGVLHLPCSTRGEARRPPECNSAMQTRDDRSRLATYRSASQNYRPDHRRDGWRRVLGCSCESWYRSPMASAR